MEISVIIPTYKPDNYIYDCLNSIRNQSFNCDYYEVKVVLNGPKYPFFDNIKRFLAENNINNAEILYTELTGVSNARNLALDTVCSEYVVFIDDDDIVSANYLEELHKKATSNTIAVSNVKTFQTGINITGDDYLSKCFARMKSDHTYNIFKYRSFLSSACCKIIPVKVIKDKRFNPKYKLGEDALFMFSLSNKIRRIVLCEEGVIYYRRLRDGSASRSNYGIIDLVANAFNILFSYTVTYLRHPFQYNLILYISRFPAVIIRLNNILKMRKH